MKLYKQKLLSDTQLKKLGEHKYSCQSVSFLDKLLQPYWCWLVLKVPIWLAPNLITVLGLCVNIFTSLLLIWYSPDAKAEAPRWVCALCALGLFIYQSLDAIDGKQARRTNSSNPLGELFDHGCDSISTVFVALSACTAVQLGYYPGWMFFQCFCAMTLFYCAHWQTYVSGTLRFGKVDVTEAQFTIIGILLISSIFGPTVWSTKLTTMNVEMKLILIVLACMIALFLAQSNLSIIFTGGVGKNGSTVAGTSVLSPVIPFSMVLVPAFIIYKKSTQEIYQNHPALYILAFGLVAAKVTNRLVVAHMTKSEMDYMDWSLMGPAMLFLNQYFNTFINEYYVLWLCLIWVAIDLLRYCSQICHEICDSLHLELFKIPYPGGPMRSYVSSSASVEKNEFQDVAIFLGHNEKRFESDDEDIRPLLKDEEEV
ncbi:choline/ethanolaminephosphotransferase 1 isoform X3 [Diabrotica virgifera virgifera]|uniref:diacylglycerol cholinephosphotransferase n=1 Tax=Diabrotica virgifera virgifera TaxID=50390 RepID=A0A6P7FJ51_DIAVI|nr:choline/ethanolaminephosphotransferase 1 isoform X3 [Diabrotica virgifera virgifera]